ncbi:MAG: hypothetical protein RL037_338 [Bacteroidota bacterium]
MNSSNNLPEDFERRMREQYPFAQTLFEELNTKAPISIRKHPYKKTEGYEYKAKVPWSKNGFYLHERPIFTLDPNFHGGAYYPQEAGSMYLETMLNHLDLTDSPLVLDACAAPGGKTSILAEKLSNRGILISNEVIKSRAAILVETITKWGFVNQIVTSNDTKTFRKSTLKFDLIVVDAPCSGEGMFRKDLKARDEWSERNCALCETRQRDILENLIPILKNNGYLIYSTCTFNPSENEELLRDFIVKFNLSVCEMPQFEGIIKDKEGIGQYFFPGNTESEGFYCAVLRKKDNDNIESRKTIISYISETPSFIIENPLSFSCIESNGYIIASTQEVLALSKQMKENFYVLKTGITVSQLFGKKEVPQIDLALSPFLGSSVEKINLEKQEALKFLKGETFPIDTTKGYKEITYGEISLGFINHLGNRFNNLFPNDWRIKMKID